MLLSRFSLAPGDIRSRSRWNGNVYKRQDGVDESGIQVPPLQGYGLKHLKLLEFPENLGRSQHATFPVLSWHGHFAAWLSRCPDIAIETTVCVGFPLASHIRRLLGVLNWMPLRPQSLSTLIIRKPDWAAYEITTVAAAKD
jgi:hypothetical protein